MAGNQDEQPAKDVNALQIHLLHPAAPDDLDHRWFRYYFDYVVVDHLLWPSVDFSEWYQDLKLPVC